MFGALASALGLGSIGGALGNIAGGLFGNEFQSDEATFARDWSAGEAQKNRDWQEMMSNTAYQRQISDMKAAGLNPMLAAMKGGGASTPSGAMGQTVSAGHSNNLTGGMDVTTASQLETAATQRKNVEADTGVKNAQKAEIEARTPTYAVSMEAMRTQIQHTLADIQRVVSQTGLNVTSAAHQEQQVVNLRALLPQIEATVAQLRAQAKLTTQQTGLAKAQTHESYTRSGEHAARDEEIRQRIRADLPAAEAALLKVQEALRTLERPQAGMRAATYSTPIGAIGEMMRALNPFLQHMPSSTTTTIQHGR